MTAKSPRRWWVLGALVLSAIVVGVDVNVLSVALPTLARDLGASTAQLQWIVDSYTLVGAALLLPAGMLGDRFGRKRILLVSIAAFGVASVACALAPSADALIVTRGALGAAAAFILPLTIAVLPVLFDGPDRSRAITVATAANVAALPLGPILGGILLSNFWWGSVFLVNVPFVALAFVAVWRLMPESRGAATGRFDVAGIGVSAVALVSLVFGVISAGESGWTNAATLVPLTVGLVALVLFVAWERRVERRGGQPLADLSLFRSRAFTTGTALATLVIFAMFGMSFTVPQYFQAIGGADVLAVGLRMVPMVGGLLVGAAIAQRLVGRLGPKGVVAIGFAVLAGAYGVGATTSLGSGDGFVLGWITAMGLGLGFAMPTTIDVALGALSADRAGAGTALMMSVRQVGGAFGVAILGSILNATYRAGVDVAGLPAEAAAIVQKSVFGGIAVAARAGSDALLASVRTSFVFGMDLLLVACAGIAVVAAVVALAFLPRSAAAVETSGEIGPAQTKAGAAFEATP
jgi:MFS transporter, DHA2 family, multidrug resistance protein